MSVWGCGITPKLVRARTALIYTGELRLDARTVLDAITVSGVQAISHRRDLGATAVTFFLEEEKEQFLDLGTIKIGSSSYLIQDEKVPLRYVNIYNAPPELPDGVLIGNLSRFGEVKHYRRGRHTSVNLENGVRHARMRLTASLPSYIRVGGEVLRVSHEGQDATCRKCNLPGHLASQCSAVACNHCGSPNHLARDCNQWHSICALCAGRHHHDDCPFDGLGAEQALSYARETGTTTPCEEGQAAQAAVTEEEEEFEQDESEEDGDEKSQDEEPGTHDQNPPSPREPPLTTSSSSPTTEDPAQADWARRLGKHNLPPQLETRPPKRQQQQRGKETARPLPGTRRPAPTSPNSDSDSGKPPAKTKTVGSTKVRGGKGESKGL